MISCNSLFPKSGYFLETEPGNFLVPWSLVGLLLVNFTTTLIHSAVWHPKLKPRVRLENCLTAFVLLDLAEMLATETAQRLGVKKCRVWLPKVTQTNLQELAGCVAIQVCSLDGQQHFMPWRSSELVLEQYFGFMRGQYQSSQFRTRDYLHSSAKKCYVTLNQLKGGGAVLADDAPSMHGPVSDDQFIEVAERSLTSALRLMAVCSEHLVHLDLRFSLCQFVPVSFDV